MEQTATQPTEIGEVVSQVDSIDTVDEHVTIREDSDAQVHVPIPSPEKVPGEEVTFEPAVTEQLLLDQTTGSIKESDVAVAVDPELVLKGAYEPEASILSANEEVAPVLAETPVAVEPVLEQANEVSAEAECEPSVVNSPEASSLVENEGDVLLPVSTEGANPAEVAPEAIDIPVALDATDATISPIDGTPELEVATPVENEADTPAPVEDDVAAVSKQTVDSEPSVSMVNRELAVDHTQEAAAPVLIVEKPESTLTGHGVAVEADPGSEQAVQSPADMDTIIPVASQEIAVVEDTTTPVVERDEDAQPLLDSLVAGDTTGSFEQVNETPVEPDATIPPADEGTVGQQASTLSDEKEENALELLDFVADVKPVSKFASEEPADFDDSSLPVTAELANPAAETLPVQLADSSVVAPVVEQMEAETGPSEFEVLTPSLANVENTCRLNEPASEGAGKSDAAIPLVGDEAVAREFPELPASSAPADTAEIPQPTPLEHALSPKEPELVQAVTGTVVDGTPFQTPEALSLETTPEEDGEPTNPSDEVTLNTMAAVPDEGMCYS
jgi:hypothetical protein